MLTCIQYLSIENMKIPPPHLQAESRLTQLKSQIKLKLKFLGQSKIIQAIRDTP